MTFVTVLILTTPFFSSSIIPTLVPTSTSAAVERVVGANEPPNPVTPVVVHTDNAQNSTNPTQDISLYTTSSRSNAPANKTVVDSASTRVANPDSVRMCVNSDSAQSPSLAHSGLDFIGDSSGNSVVGPANQPVDSLQQPTGSATVGDSDVIMADDVDLPTYLTKMIGYLRGVAADREWQDLVTKFVTFEKMGHPVNGVSTM